MSSHEREVLLPGSTLGERDLEAFEDAWYRALKARQRPAREAPSGESVGEPTRAERAPEHSATG